MILRSFVIVTLERGIAWFKNSDNSGFLAFCQPLLVQVYQYVTPEFRGTKTRARTITRCAGTKSHTYDESWHRIECHIFTI
jgi:hypothetical protein